MSTDQCITDPRQHDTFICTNCQTQSKLYIPGKHGGMSRPPWPQHVDELSLFAVNWHHMPVYCTEQTRMYASALQQQQLSE